MTAAPEGVELLTNPPYPPGAQIAVETTTAPAVKTGKPPAASEPRRRIKAVHAETVALSTDLDVSTVLQRVGRACVEHLVRNEDAALSGSAEGIHQMRVAVRRLRAIQSAFGPLLPKRHRRRASAGLRWFADILGEARNLDVFAETLLEPARAALPAASEFERLARAVAERRKAAQAAVTEAILSPHYTGAVLDLLRWFDARGWEAEGETDELRQPIGVVAPVLLERRRYKAKKRAKHFAKQSAPARHQLRIALKKLRYTAEALGSLYDPPAVEIFVHRLKKLQDDLGDANDLQVGRHIVAALARSQAEAPSDTEARDGLGAGATGIALAGRRVLAWHRRRLAGNESATAHQLLQLIETEPFWRT